MLWTLLTNRFKILIYFIRNRYSQKTKQNLIRLVAILFLPYWIFQASMDLYSSWQFIPNYTTDVLINYMQITLTGLFFLMIMSGIPLALHYHYMSRDANLLTVLPIDTRTIYIYKLMELTLTNSSLFFLIGFPVILATVFFMKISIIYYIPLLLLVFLYLFIPSGIASILSALMAFVLPVKRTRQVSSIILGLIIIGIWVSMQFFNVSRLDPYSHSFDRELHSQLLNSNMLQNYKWFPPAWFATIFKTFLTNNLSDIVYYGSLFILTSGLLVILADKLLNQSRTRQLTSFTTQRHRKTPGLVKMRGNTINTFHVIQHLIARDYKLMFRDSRFVTQAFFYLAIIIVFPLVLSDSLPIKNETLTLLRPFILLTLVTSLMASGLAARSIPLERRSFIYNVIGPLPARTLVVSKLGVPYVTTLIVTIIGIVAVSITSKIPFAVMAVLFLLLAFHLAAISFIGLWVGLRFKTLNWDNPRQMLGETGALVLSLLTVIYTGIVVAAGLWLYLREPFAAIIVTIMVSIVMMYAGMRVNSSRLGTIEYETLVFDGKNSFIYSLLVFRQEEQ